jgi:TolA-binding protein
MPGRAPKGHRLTRGELKEDKFVTEVLRVVRFLDRRRKEVGAVAAVIVIAAAAVVVVRARARSEEQEAARLLAVAEIALAAGDRDEAVAGYRHLMEVHERTTAGREAAVYLGQLLLEQGDIEAARGAFQFTLAKPPSRLLRMAADAGLADVLEEQGDVAGAADAYEELAVRYEGTYAGPEMLLHAGRCRQRLGQWDAAVSLFSDIVDKYPESSLIPTAQFELAYSRTKEEQGGT